MAAQRVLPSGRIARRANRSGPPRDPGRREYALARRGGFVRSHHSHYMVVTPLRVGSGSDMPMIMTVPVRRELTVDGQTLVLCRAELGEIIDLRHRVLRAGLPQETAVF